MKYYATDDEYVEVILAIYSHIVKQSLMFKIFITTDHNFDHNSMEIQNPIV